jgi:hypothetical protein
MTTSCLGGLGGFGGEGVLGFGDDDPEGEVDEHADACEENDEEGEDAGEVEVPAVVAGKAGADSGDHAILAGAGELAGAWVGCACLGWGCGRDGGSAGWAKAGVGIYLLAALRTEHWGASGRILFCHRKCGEMATRRSCGY